MKILFIIAVVLYVISLLVVSVDITAGTWINYAAFAAALIGLMIRLRVFSR